MRNFKNYFFYAVHRLILRLGLFITPIHYHAAVPDILRLEATKRLGLKHPRFPALSST